MTITAVNDKPDAVGDAKTLDEDAGATAIDVLGNDDDIDGNTLTITSVTQRRQGLGRHHRRRHGAVLHARTRTPTAADTFSYTISDGHGMSDTADVSITIDPVNDAPVAADDTPRWTRTPAPPPIDVLGNDSDIDGDGLTIMAKTDGAIGRRRDHRRRRRA